jgi:predicted enzyme related to lactoylglutathione lyase
MKTNQLIFNITSEQPEKLDDFYANVVGLEREPNSGGFLVGGALFTIDGHSETKGRAREPHRYLFSFTVDDAKAERERLEAQGVQFVRKEGREFWGGVFSTFVDPDGNYGQLMEFRPEAAGSKAGYLEREKSMSNQPQFGFAIEYVKDIEAAERFYVDVLGLRVERTFPTFVQFEHFAIAADQPLGGAEETELYWLVDDAESAFSKMSEQGEVTLALTQQPYGKVFGIRGPAGRSCFVLELAQDRPSEAV